MVERAAAVAAVLVVLALAAAVPAAGDDGSPDESAHGAWRQGYALHLMGRYEAAVRLFRRSIAIRPSAEGHTFLGWSLSRLGRLAEAIDECKKAIRIDPDYGNPYNDIGAYLIELERPDEAVPWLERAMRARRYCCYQFPHANLGRVLLGQQRRQAARRAFERALEYDPDYTPARRGLELIRRYYRSSI